MRARGAGPVRVVDEYEGGRQPALAGVHYRDFRAVGAHHGWRTWGKAGRSRHARVGVVY